MNKIYQLNEAEGIFYPAFDKYICRDEQVSMDKGEIVRLWDSLTFKGDSSFTVHWSGEAELSGYDNFLAFLSFPAEASMKVTGVVDGESCVLVENAKGDENPVELKGGFAPSGGGGRVLTDIYLTLTSPSNKNVVILSWLGLSRSDREAALEEAVPRWKEEWDAQIKRGCVGKLDKSMVLEEEEGERLLPDLGTVSYGNSKSLLMDKQSYHNVACPVDLVMKPESETGMKAAAAAAYPITENLTIEDMAIPEAKVLYHKVLEDGYAFGVETGMLFGENIKGTREGRLSSQCLQLTDNWSFEEAHPLQVTFLAYHPWEINEDGGSAVSGIMTLWVQAGEEIRFETEGGMTDGQEKDVYVLRIQTPAALSHTINSRLTWKEKELSEQNSGAVNRQILQELLNKGGTVRIKKPGTYEIEDTVYIKSSTHLILGKGVVFKRSASSAGSFFLTNEGAFTGKQDSDITIEGLNLITNGVEARHNAAVYGLTGEISLFRVKHLRIFDFTCMDLPKLSYGLHICTFEDIVLERLQIEGRKDAVHLGTGKQC